MRITEAQMYQGLEQNLDVSKPVFNNWQGLEQNLDVTDPKDNMCAIRYLLHFFPADAKNCREDLKTSS